MLIFLDPAPHLTRKSLGSCSYMKALVENDGCADDVVRSIAVLLCPHSIMTHDPRLFMFIWIDIPRYRLKFW